MSPVLHIFCSGIVNGVKYRFCFAFGRLHRSNSDKVFKTSRYTLTAHVFKYIRTDYFYDIIAIISQKNGKCIQKSG